MSMNYTSYCNSMRVLLAEPQSGQDTSFEEVVDRMIEYAELRIYRELDFLNTRSVQTGALVSGARSATIPATIIIVEGANVITPAGTSNPANGTRVPLMRMSLAFINTIWPTAATTGTPQYFAMQDNTTAIFAPTPSGAFTAEYIGIIRPTALSSSNTTTFITANLPDLFVAASMVFGAGYQKNFGAQAGDPSAAMSWEKQYQTLRDGVQVEELRRKSQSWQWTATQPSPIANTPRDKAAAPAAP